MVIVVKYDMVTCSGYGDSSLYELVTNILRVRGIRDSSLN